MRLWIKGTKNDAFVELTKRKLEQTSLEYNDKGEVVATCADTQENIRKLIEWFNEDSKGSDGKYRNGTLLFFN